MTRNQRRRAVRRHLRLLAHFQTCCNCHYAGSGPFLPCAEG